MPELPEVETIRQTVAKQVVGTTINSVWVLNSNTVDKMDADDFINAIAGSAIKGIGRRGKYFLFSLSSGTMVLHLRMAGQLFVTEHGIPTNSYTCIAFNLNDGRVLRFDDKRKFARAYFIPAGVEDTVSGVSKLGLEPFDKRLTTEYLKYWWQHQTCTIKEALLDQSVVAGFGNLYSDELLFKCGIYPCRRCNNLIDSEYERIVENMPVVMQWGLELNRQYGLDKKEHLYVYDRTCKPCKVCGTRIEEKQIGGRKCRYCPTCQPEMRKTMERNIEVTPEMFGEVAMYIGASIKTYGHCEDYSFPDESGHGMASNQVTVGEFLLNAYRFVTEPDVVNLDYGDDVDDQRKIKKFIRKRMSKEVFNDGVEWIKSRVWKE